MRLIDADAIPWQECLDTNGYTEPLDKVIAVIQNMPTIEAEPVKHGRWLKRGDNSWECSVCHEISCCNGNYCVDCGADMREVKE